MVEPFLRAALLFLKNKCFSKSDVFRIIMYGFLFKGGLEMVSNFSIFQVLFLLITTILGVVCSVIYHQPLVIGFMPGFLVLVYLAFQKGMSLKQTLKISFIGVYKTRIVIIILFLVSFLLPSWYLSGTIGQMVKVALNFINSEHFLVLSFLVALVFSMLLGTTVGTLSAIGVPILGNLLYIRDMGFRYRVISSGCTKESSRYSKGR